MSICITKGTQGAFNLKNSFEVTPISSIESRSLTSFYEGVIHGLGSMLEGISFAGGA